MSNFTREDLLSMLTILGESKADPSDDSVQNILCGKIQKALESLVQREVGEKLLLKDVKVDICENEKEAHNKVVRFIQDNEWVCLTSDTLKTIFNWLQKKE